MKDIKEKFIKIKEFILKHYVIFIPICLIIVLLLTYAIFTIKKIYDNYSIETKEEGYVYFAGIKITDDFTIKTNRYNEIIDVKTVKQVDLDRLIYSNKSNKVIFMKDMNILFIYDNYKQFRTSKYSTLDYDSKNNSYKLKAKGYEKEVNDFILYDGEDLYFLAMPSTLKIDNEEIELSAMSYVIVNNRNSLQYYDKKSDKIVIRDITNEKISVYNDTYNINLNEDTAIRLSSFVLLSKPKDLNYIS